ncbi:MAG TPA: sorbosone dehydrogenase family protein [Candidatus Binatia bacterium]|jgi:glucose/arabinose dehydrogenase
MRLLISFALLLLTFAPLPAAEISHLTDAELAQRIRLPAGFEIRIFARGLMAPRFMTVGPDNLIYVSMPSMGWVGRLRDDDGDGKVERIDRVIQDLDRPHGLAFHDGKLYVAGTQKVWRVDRFRGDGQPGQTTTIVSNLSDGGHWTRTILFGPDGKLYLSVGSSCNVCKEKDPRRAGIVRYNSDGSGEEIFATGLRNSVGIAWHPLTKELWGTDNGRDWLGDDSPPDEINIIRQGKVYGWPNCIADRVPDPDFGTAEICQKTEPPAIKLQAHSAPLGLAFYTGKQFPQEYQDDLFVALHGSWNRSKKTGYKVVRIKLDKGQVKQVEDFATGWLMQEKGADVVWGRPVDLVVGPDGSLYLSDDSAGFIYKISYKGKG